MVKKTTEALVILPILRLLKLILVLLLIWQVIYAFWVVINCLLVPGHGI